MTFKVISESEKTCQVGNGNSTPAIVRGYAGVITIPSSANEYKVTSIGDDAFHNCSYLTSVTIPEGVTSIGDWAFCGCIGLTSITIPSSVTSIGYSAFDGCFGLTSITIPSSVTSIGDKAFWGCSGPTSIKVENGNTKYDSRENCNAIIETSSNTLIAGCRNTIIPSSVTSIGSGAFGFCSGLTSITIPEGVTSIEGWAFSDCSGLTSITNPEGVTSIGESAFSGCSGLTSITIPSSVTSIGNQAFIDCSGLTSITIPSSVTSIEGLAFAGCSGLTSIKVENGNTKYDSRENCNAIIEKSSNTLIAGCRNTIIPSSVTSIGSSAFWCCSSLTSITIPSNVTSIGWGAFGYCSSLTSITIPSSVTSIGDWAFCYCSGLTSVTVCNKTPVSIDERTFSNRTNATLYVPYGCKAAYEAADYWKDFKEIKEIGSEGVFTAQTAEGVDMTFKVISENEKTCMVGLEEDNVASITETYNGGITIPSVVNGYTVKRIGKWAFSWRGGLTSVSIPETVESIGFQAFIGAGMTAITLPGNLTTIEDCAFQGCTGITSVTIPASVTSIAVGTFDDANLASIKVENGNQVYDSRNDCNAIIETATNTLVIGCQNTAIPDDVEIIGTHAFVHCYGLESITIPSSVKSIGGRAFFGCSNLASVSLPENLETIDGDAFGGCESLTSIVIPASVTSIGDYIFAGCRGLTSIVVEDGNTVYDCRDNCNAIIETSTNTLIAGCKNTIIPNTVTCIGNGAFNDLTNLTSIEIPSSVTTLKWWAFHDCGLTSINIPAGVTTIEAGAFEACDNLTSVTVNNPVPVDLSCGGIHTSYVFSNYANTTLYVPAGSKSAYENADYWNEFKEIVEMPKKTSSLAISDASGLVGCTFNLPVSMKNEDEITAMQFELSLPEGVSVASATLTDRKDGHTIDYTLQANGNYQFTVFSSSSKSINGNEGDVANISLNISNSVAPGNYTMQLKNIELTTTAGDAIHQSDLSATLTVLNLKQGDANGDNKITITDAVGIVNYILGHASSNFHPEAADLNGDNNISITDAVRVVNIILNQGSAGVKEKRTFEQEKEREPQ